MKNNALFVKLNRTSFEYDIHALLKAFYPERNVKVLTPESRMDKMLLSAEREAGEWARGEEASEELWWQVEISDAGAKITTPKQEYEWQADIREGLDGGKCLKEGFKVFFYKTLEEETGKSLPWGNLTGIRPTKIAYGMLEEGKGRPEIMDFMEKKHFVSREKAALSADIAERERELLSLAGCGSSRQREEGYSLYVGIPFCPTTCLYCSFTSYPIAAYRKKTEQYLDCLIKEMKYVAECYKGKILHTVYIGGGTPTTLEAEQLHRLIGALRELFDFSQVKEFTVEAGRADSITEEKLKVLYHHGVSRISVNPQTMKQETLDIIGRRATVEQVIKAFYLARQVGFDNINMDLILGLPGELAADVRSTIDRVVELEPDSLTVHSLAVKRASRLNQWIQQNGISMLRNTDETMEIAAKGAKKLGMEPYYLYRQKNMSGNFENVGYAKPGKYGLYNILIMEEMQTIVALGAGSISKRVFPDGRIERSENVKDVDLYIEKIDEMIERKRKLLED